MSFLALPTETLQQVLSETLFDEHFARLRLVHSHINDSILASAGYLSIFLLQGYGVSSHVLSLQQRAYDLKQDTIKTTQKLVSLLELHNNVRTCILLERILETHWENFAAFPIWADLPAKGFANIQEVLVFSAFQRALRRNTFMAQDVDLTLSKIAIAGSGDDHFVWISLDQQLTDFIKHELTLDDLQALMTIVNFCAISTRLVDTVLTWRCYFSDAGAADRWQDIQLASALLAERILWRGPSWLARMLCKNVDKDLSTIPVQPNMTTSLSADSDHTLWMGPRAEAVKFTANGIARLLWHERSRRLRPEQKAAETSGIQTKSGRPELRVDPAVWRGSSGGL